MANDTFSVEERVREMGLVLPGPLAPAANYANAVRVGDLVYLSGTVPVGPGGDVPTGKVGADVTADVANQHARWVGLHHLAILRHELGSRPR